MFPRELATNTREQVVKAEKLTIRAMTTVIHDREHVLPANPKKEGREQARADPTLTGAKPEPPTQARETK
jgi:hypothetical protein